MKGVKASSTCICSRDRLSGLCQAKPSRERLEIPVDEVNSCSNGCGNGNKIAPYNIAAAFPATAPASLSVTAFVKLSVALILEIHGFSLSTAVVSGS